MQQQVAPIQEGNFLIITSRICSDNIQPQVHKGDIYVIDRQLTLPTGNVTVLCHRPSEPKKVFRITDRLHACLVAMQSPFQLKQPSTHVTTFNRIIDNQLQLIQVIPA